MNTGYFDWAAGAPPCQDILRGALDSAAELFANPSSQHRQGRAARAALEDSRSRIATALGCRGGSLVFTSGASESNAIVVHSLLTRPNKPSLAISSLEHPSIYANALSLRQLGHELDILPVGPEGRIVSEKAMESLDRGRRFFSFIAVQNEVGIIEDIGGLCAKLRAAARARGYSLHIHVDAVQALGKMALSVSEMGMDSLSLSSHKIGGPRGCGLLWLAKPLNCLARGGEQEHGIRPGTEDLFAALATAAVIERRLTSLESSLSRAKAQMAWLLDGLTRLGAFILPTARVAHPEGYSPYILQCGFLGIPGEVMVRRLSDLGFSISTGSACSSAKRDRRVLDAMGIGQDVGLCAIRISLGWDSGDEGLAELLTAITRVKKELLGG